MNIVAGCPPRAGSVDYVDGRTRLFGIVGYPIEQARSPQTVTFELRRRAANAILFPIMINPEEFDDVFPRLLRLGNLDGLVITIPFKKRAIAHVQHVGPIGQITGAISVLGRSLDDRWTGEMFDGAGCVRAIRRRGVSLGGSRTLVLGAGGAGTAIAFEVARQKPDILWLHDPDKHREETLAAGIRAAFPSLQLGFGKSSFDDLDILINASPVGMLDDDACPIYVTRLPRHLVVMDAIMDPDRTKMLRIAEESGCLAVYGREMLDAQIEAACDYMLSARQLQSSQFDQLIGPAGHD